VAINDPTILTKVENAIFDMFAAKMGDARGITCAVGDIPPQAYNFWSFEINGGGEPLDAMFTNGFPGNCGRWRMNAMVRGIFAERSDAQLLAGVVRTIVPIVEGGLANVHWLRPLSEPTFASVDVPDRQGGFIECLQVEYPLEVIMKDDGVA